MTRFFIALCLWLNFAFAAQPAVAQYFPGYDDPFVNDIAKMLTDETEETLRRKLTSLKADTGVEMSILTVNDMATYGDWTDIADFGTQVFNEWGIGDAEKNNGLLMLIAKNDREFRIAVGRGYPPIYDDIAADIIQFHMVPAFKDGDFDDGVLDGAQKMMELMALPFEGGELSPKRPDKPNSGVPFVLWGMGIFFGGAIGATIFGPRYSRYKFSKKPCPQCGRTGMTRDVETVTAATRSEMGLRLTKTDCPYCDYHDTSKSLISRISSNRNGSGGSSFGGGSSSGGGASGKW